jgi:hypothetical protein
VVVGLVIGFTVLSEVVFACFVAGVDVSFTKADPGRFVGVALVKRVVVFNGVNNGPLVVLGGDDGYMGEDGLFLWVGVFMYIGADY